MAISCKNLVKIGYISPFSPETDPWTFCTAVEVADIMICVNLGDRFRGVGSVWSRLSAFTTEKASRRYFVNTMLPLTCTT